MKILFVVNISMSILYCVVRKETFSKRRFDHEAKVQGSLGGKTILRKLRLLIPHFVISVHRSRIEF